MVSGSLGHVSDELNIGDLCVFTGKQSEYSLLHRRVIYRVVEKETRPDNELLSTRFTYRFQVAFDLENPTGTVLTTTGKMGVHDMKRLSLLDVATIRLHYDHFIKEWARTMGEANPDDVR